MKTEKPPATHYRIFQPLEVVREKKRGGGATIKLLVNDECAEVIMGIMMTGNAKGIRRVRNHRPGWNEANPMNCRLQTCNAPLRLADNTPPGETLCPSCRERVRGLDLSYPLPPGTGWRFRRVNSTNDQ